MSVTNHERPGVYSRYDASTVVKGRGGGRSIRCPCGLVKGNGFLGKRKFNAVRA